MAIDQREALIEAIRKQVEKERAEKAAKLKKEQESMMFAKGGAAVKEKKESSKQKFKTLSAEDLARIEEKKRKKRAEAMGMTLEEYERNMNAPLEPEPAPEEKEAAEEAEMMSKIAEKAKADAKAKAEEEAKGGMVLRLSSMVVSDNIKKVATVLVRLSEAGSTLTSTLRLSMILTINSLLMVLEP